MKTILTSAITSLLVFSTLSVSAPSAKALLPEPIPNLGGRAEILDFDSFVQMMLDDRYRIGDEWGKKPVTQDSLKSESSAFQRAALATARMGGATAFYLGKFNGHHIMATNHHVLPRDSKCLGGFARFPLIKKAFKCVTFLGEWTDIDLALFEIEVSDPVDEQALLGIGKNFSFDTKLSPGQPLITIGFGVADNPARELVANKDADCKVFSAENDFHFMADPDELNPGPYKAWSFANGCDVSHGDSGSAMVDRATGNVVGIIWTGRIPKNSKVQDSAFLDQLLKSQGPEIWNELSYAVPAPKIKEHLDKVVQDTNLDVKVREMIQSVISP